jgi:type IV pilus assembly protein PilW
MKTLKTPRRQRGVTLIELMVGLVIGLMVVAAAMAALMVSRSISGTVSDASGIQQQAAYAMRSIGGQLRQAGSLFLNPEDPITGTSTDPLSAVVFETDAIPTDNTILAFKQENTIKSDSSTGDITIAFRRYKDAVYSGSTATALARNCVGGPADNSKDEAIQSIFSFNSSKNELHCGGNGEISQPIMQNVAQFQVTYAEQIFDPAGTTVKYVDAAGVTDWRSVQGVQVCMVLYGNESINMPSGSEYTGCDDKDGDGQPDKEDMTSLTGVRKNRMHLTFRNTFQLRSQGLL